MRKKFQGLENSYFTLRPLRIVKVLGTRHYRLWLFGLMFHIKFHSGAWT